MKKHQTMDRKTFLKWLGAVLIGLCSGNGILDKNNPVTKKHNPKEARHYRSSRHLAG